MFQVHLDLQLLIHSEVKAVAAIIYAALKNVKRMKIEIRYSCFLSQKETGLAAAPFLQINI